MFWDQTKLARRRARPSLQGSGTPSPASRGRVGVGGAQRSSASCKQPGVVRTAPHPCPPPQAGEGTTQRVDEPSLRPRFPRRAEEPSTAPRRSTSSTAISPGRGASVAPLKLSTTWPISSIFFHAYSPIAVMRVEMPGDVEFGADGGRSRRRRYLHAMQHRHFRQFRRRAFREQDEHAAFDEFPRLVAYGRDGCAEASHLRQSSQTSFRGRSSRSRR